jgi:hypothetical protein
MRDVYLLGIDHSYQAGRVASISRFFGKSDPTKNALDEFRALLRRTVRAHSLRGIAEEMHPDALVQKYGTGSSSLPYQVAAETGVKHLYCEPSRARRKELDLDSDSKREAYWLCELECWDAFPALFVLGATHVESFGALLSKAHFRSHVVAGDWSPNGDGKTA